MDITTLMIIAGLSFMAVGVVMNFRGKGSEVTDAGGKGVVIKAPAYVMIAGLGAALVISGAWFAAKNADRQQNVPQQTTTTSPPEIFEPFTLGDDRVLDVLWLQCSTRNWQACDDLYQRSPVGSDYEQFGATCGGLMILADGLFCVDAPAEEKLPHSD